MRHLCILIFAAAALTGCDTRPNSWTGWVYPDRNDLTVSISLEGFRTFEQCQEATVGRLRSLPDPAAADYECGYRCRWEPALNTNVCKETRR